MKTPEQIQQLLTQFELNFQAFQKGSITSMLAASNIAMLRFILDMPPDNNIQAMGNAILQRLIDNAPRTTQNEETEVTE
jgi:hypothetical protein